MRVVLFLHSMIHASCLPALPYREKVHRFACSTGLALATYLAFGFFCFIPVILDVAEARSLERSRRNIGQDMGVTYRRIYEEIEQEGL